MTTEYSSKKEAFWHGAAMAGYKTAEAIAKVLEEAEVEHEEVVNPLVMWLGDSEEDKRLKEGLTRKAESRTITAANGKKVKLAVSPFREGYELVMINPDTGFGFRT